MNIIHSKFISLTLIIRGYLLVRHSIDYNLALIQSISGGYDDIVERLLLDSDINPNDYISICGIKKYPIIESVKKNSLDILKLLVRSGASLTVVDDKGNTPLHYASMHESCALLVFILGSNPASINSFNKIGKSSLDIAADYGNIEAIDKLCAAGAISSSVISTSESSKNHFENLVSIFDIDQILFGKQVMRAVIYNDIASIEILYDKSFLPIDFLDDSGNTLLHIAIKLHYGKIVNILLNAGADPYRENSDGIAPIDISSGMVSKEMHSLILNRVLALT